jgi:hypothetical protein
MALITKMLGIAISDCDARRITPEQLLAILQEAVDNGDILEEANEFHVVACVVPLIDRGILRASEHVQVFEARMNANAAAAAREYRRMTHATPAEFIAALEADFARELDATSALFFRHHPATVDLVHQMLQGALREDQIDDERQALVLQMLLLDMIGYAASEVARLAPEDRTRLSSVLPAFSKTYPDAGHVIGQALAAYLRCEQE